MTCPLPEDHVPSREVTFAASAVDPSPRIAMTASAVCATRLRIVLPVRGRLLLSDEGMVAVMADFDGLDDDEDASQTSIVFCEDVRTYPQRCGG